MVQCSQAKKRIQEEKKKQEEIAKEKTAIKGRVKEALLTLTKGRVGLEFFDPKPFNQQLNRAYVTDIIELAKDLPNINQEPYFIQTSILHNKFDSKLFNVINLF